MDYGRKRTIATVVLIIAVGLTFWGFNRIQTDGFAGHVTAFTKVVFFGSALTGIVAAMCRYYWRGMRSMDDNSQKIVMDAYGEIGRQKLEEKRRRKLN